MVYCTVALIAKYRNMDILPYDCVLGNYFSIASEVGGFGKQVSRAQSSLSEAEDASSAVRPGVQFWD